MKKNLKKLCLLGSLLVGFSGVYAQSFTWISSTDNDVWKEAKTKLQISSRNTPVLSVNGTENIQTFKKWGDLFQRIGLGCTQYATDGTAEYCFGQSVFTGW